MSAPTPEEIKAAADAAQAEADAKAKEEADELIATGITTDAGKAALKAERDARKLAAKEARELKEQLTALQGKQAEADAAKAKADEAEAIRKGEFEALANTRAEEVKTVTGERDGYKTQLDTLIAAIRPDVETQWKEIPDEIKAFFDGADDDVIAKSKFLAKSKPAIDKLTAQADERKKALGGIPTTPRPNGKGVTPSDEQARRAQSQTVSTI